MATSIPTPLVPRDDQLEALADAFQHAKSLEAHWRNERIFAEEQILKLIGHKAEGSTKVHTDHYQITTTGRVTRSIDEQRLADAYERNLLPKPLLDRVFKTKHAIDLAQLRYVEMNEPEYFSILCDIVTSKDAKPGVAVKEVE